MICPDDRRLLRAIDPHVAASQSMVQTLSDQTLSAEERLRQCVYCRGFPSILLHHAGIDLAMSRVDDVPPRSYYDPWLAQCRDRLEQMRGWLEGTLSEHDMHLAREEVRKAHASLELGMWALSSRLSSAAPTSDLEATTSTLLRETTQAFCAVSLAGVVCRTENLADEPLSLGQRILYSLNTRCSNEERSWLCVRIVARWDERQEALKALVSLLQQRGQMSHTRITHEQSRLEEGLF